MSIELGGPWWAWVLVGAFAYFVFIAVAGAAAERAAAMIVRRALHTAEDAAREAEDLTQPGAVRVGRHGPVVTFEEPFLRPVDVERKPKKEDDDGTPTAQ